MLDWLSHFTPAEVIVCIALGWLIYYASWIRRHLQAIHIILSLHQQRTALEDAETTKHLLAP
jgi:uncharacterized membrane protein YciS (DUF1049 family)